ncbi:E3 ubiquitin-protein ligase IPI1-like isoform X2 [Magnolia sinica]|nr:E3 ubiquitin-protein ligase IPI1-like isoform X2 [Magnolia sinica]
MQCPNCRKVEKGQWLYANGCRSFAEHNVEELVNEDLYDLSYSELPLGLPWCPVRGFMQLASWFEEGEPQLNTYPDLLGSTVFGDHPNAPSGTHVCPYLALHGFPHAIHHMPSNSADAVPDSTSFHRHPTGSGGSSSSNVLNSHGFSASEPRHHNWQQASVPFPVSGGSVNNTEQPASQLGARLSRNDSSGPQRTGSYVQPLPFIHGTVARATSNLAASLLPPLVGDARNQARGHVGHIYQHSASSSLRSGPFTPNRRTRQRGLTVISSAGTNSSADNGGLYGFSFSGSMNRNPQESDGIGRHFDRFYGWVREGIASLPWVPAEGESHQWWGPFHPNHNPQTGSVDSMSRSYFHQRATSAERAVQGRPDNNYQRVPHPRMTHFM